MSVRNSLIILPLLLLSLSVNAGFLSDIKGKLFGNDTSVFLECIDTLEKKDVGKSKAKQLCIDKYANTIDNDDWRKSKSEATKNGKITFQLHNDSNYVIKKIEYSGRAECEDTNACERQYFYGFKYVDIKPNSDKSITLYGQFSIPDDVIKGDWNWAWESITWWPGNATDTLNQAFGFKLDY